MAILYTTVEKEAHYEQIIEKSKFIAHVKAVYSKEEADEYISLIRKQYKDATHNVPAYVIGEKQQLQWGSDDGEPSGTSAAPIVQMLVSEGLTNLVVVVTRYFGGIKLGTGGLVRAYTSSAKGVINEASKHDFKEFEEQKIRFDYSLLGKIQNLALSMPFSVRDIEYGDKVVASLEYEPEFREQMNQVLSDIFGGKKDLISQKKFVK